MGKQSSSVYRSLLHYDLAGFPGGLTPIAAFLDGVSTLELTPTLPCLGKRLTTTTWGETTATWNTSDGSAAWSPPNAVSPQTGPYSDVGAVAINLPNGALLGNYNPFSVPGFWGLVLDAIANRGGQLHLIIMVPDETDIYAGRPEFTDKEDTFHEGAAAPKLRVICSGA